MELQYGKQAEYGLWYRRAGEADRGIGAAG